MQRVIVQSADLGSAALSEFKQWLGITRDAEDTQLVGLLSAALEMCEAFTGQAPLESVMEESLEPSGRWQKLAGKPVQAIEQVELISAEGSRSLLTSDAYEVDIDASGIGCVRQAAYTAGRAFAVRYRAGVSSDWSSLPDALRHGIIRLAAHHYRDRDMEKPVTPPASIAALWRPWRVMRLA